MASTSYNYSLFSIPAYYLLCFIPHIYSGTLLVAPKDVATKTPTGKIKPGARFYNMPNPRSSDNTEKYSKILDKSTYHKWERARAAHFNLLESSPFVISAILAGIITKLPASQMNSLCFWYLATRIAYCIAYITVERGVVAWSRTFWFMAGNGILSYMWWLAGKRVMDGSY